MDTIIRILGKKGRTTIPFIYRKILGIGYNDIISFTLNGNKIILKREKLCDNCVNSRADKIELLEFIKSLSTEEKYQVLALLTARLTKEHGAHEKNNNTLI